MSGSPKRYIVKTYDLEGRPVFQSGVELKGLMGCVAHAINQLNGEQIGSFIILLPNAIDPDPAAPNESQTAERDASVTGAGDDSRTGGAGVRTPTGD